MLILSIGSCLGVMDKILEFPVIHMLGLMLRGLGFIDKVSFAR